MERVAGHVGHCPANVVAMFAEIGHDVAMIVAKVLDDRTHFDVQFHSLGDPLRHLLSVVLAKLVGAGEEIIER